MICPLSHKGDITANSYRESNRIARSIFPTIQILTCLRQSSRCAETCSACNRLGIYFIFTIICPSVRSRCITTAIRIDGYGIIRRSCLGCIVNTDRTDFNACSISHYLQTCCSRRCWFQFQFSIISKIIICISCRCITSHKAILNTFTRIISRPN